MKAEDFFKAHKTAFEKWMHGDILKTWTDSGCFLCIQYEDGAWWHYRLTDNVIEWW